MSPRLKKNAKLLQTLACWPALLHGGAATLEHDAALGRDTFATVIDLGANKGQFAVYARTRWPNARLICFEPLPGPHAKLVRVTRGQAEIQECALGSVPGEGQMHLASRSDSSSLLALGARQKAIFGMAESGALQVPIKRLDACLSTPLPRRRSWKPIDHSKAIFCSTSSGSPTPAHCSSATSAPRCSGWRRAGDRRQRWASCAP